MSFIDLFAKGQHSSMNVQRTSSVHKGEQTEKELFISKYCSQNFDFCGGSSVHGRVPSGRRVSCLHNKSIYEKFHTFETLNNNDRK